MAAHARDELGISDTASAQPVQAALASAAHFAVGAAMPLLSVLAVPTTRLIPVVVVSSVLLLAVLGGFGAHAGGAPVMKAAWRVMFWGALAMALTAGVGSVRCGCVSELVVEIAANAQSLRPCSPHRDIAEVTYKTLGGGAQLCEHAVVSLLDIELLLEK